MAALLLAHQRNSGAGDLPNCLLFTAGAGEEANAVVAMDPDQSGGKKRTGTLADASTAVGSTRSTSGSDPDSDMETLTSSKRSNTRSAWGKGPGHRLKKQQRAAAHRAKMGTPDGLTAEEFRLKKAEEALVGGPKGTLAVDFYNKMVLSAESVTVDVRVGEFFESMAASQSESNDTTALEQRVRVLRPDGQLFCELCGKQCWAPQWSHQDPHWTSKDHQNRIKVHAGLDALVGMPLKGIRPHAGQTGFRPPAGKLTQENFIAFWGPDTELLGVKAKEMITKIGVVQWKNSTSKTGTTKTVPATEILYARTGVLSYNESSGRMSYSNESYCRLAELPPHDVFEPSPHYPNMVLDSPDHGFWPVVEIGIKGADEETLAQQLSWAKQSERPGGLRKSSGSDGKEGEGGGWQRGQEGEEGGGWQRGQDHPDWLHGRLRQIGGVWVIVYCIHQLTWAVPIGWNIPLAPYLIDMDW